MVENKVQDGAFTAIEDITIISSILGYSTPHSRVLQKTHKNYDLSVQGVKKRTMRIDRSNNDVSHPKATRCQMSDGVRSTKNV